MLLVKPSNFDKQGKKCLPELLTAALCPFLVAVFGQQLPRVQLDRRPVGGWIFGATGDVRASSKASTSTQSLLFGHSTIDSFSYQVARAIGSVEDPPGGVEGLSQVVGGSLLAQLRPEEVHHHFSVQAMTGS